MMMERKWVVGPFQCNCRLWACDRTGEAVLVDPGDEASRILEALHGLSTPSGAPIRVRYLLHTHGHLDHIGATRAVRGGIEASAPPGTEAPKIALHRGDEALYLNLQTQGQLFGMSFDQPLLIDHYLEHEEGLQIGDLRFSVIHTPGHSPGSICLRLHEDSGAGTHESLLTGDTLFQGSVGRTDLWGGDGTLLFKSIRSRILSLDDETRICPGHGADSSIRTERRENPFLT